LHYDIDYVDIDTFLNNEQNGDAVWLHVLSGFTAVIASNKSVQLTHLFVFEFDFIGCI